MFPLIFLAFLPQDPPLSDRDRFPPRHVAFQAMRFNRAYYDYVKARQGLEFHRWGEWQEIVDETDALFSAWDWLHAAQEGEGRNEEYWRLSLRRVRERIGCAAYHAGQMPPPVPIWRFRYIEYVAPLP